MHADDSVTRNTSSFGTADHVIQAGHVHGDLHVNAVPVRPAPAAPNQLPPLAHPFVGRSREISTLNSVLASLTAASELHPNTVIVSGSPGVGKSALLAEWATRNRANFPDGLLYSDANGYSESATPRGAAQMIDGFLRALGVAPASLPVELDEKALMFRSALAGRRMLVVLDNVDASERARPLLASGPSLTLIASRSMLSGLVARYGAFRMTLDMLSPEESNALIRQIIGDERVSAEPEAALELARLCAYLPLALRIAAERASAQPHARLADIVADLSSEQSRLDFMSAEDDEQTAVRAVFSWSYRPLNPDLARTFRLLGLSPVPDLSAEAAAALTGVELPAARKLLFSLVNLGLLDERSRGRYGFHDLLHVYARERAEEQESPEAGEAAIARLLGWYLDQAQAANHGVAPGAVPITPRRSGLVPFASFGAALEWFEAEKSNLRTLTQYAWENGHREFAAFAPLEMGSYFNIRKYWSDWLYCNQIGISAARQLGDAGAEAWLLTNRGTALRNLRRWNEAVQCHERALARFDATVDPAGIGYARQNLANAQADEGKFEQAIPNFRLALNSFESVPDRSDRFRGQGVTLNSMAVAYNNMGEYDNALDCAQTAIARWNDLHSPHGVAFSRHCIGGAYAGKRAYDQAVENYREALRIRREIHDTHGEGRALVSLGQTQRLQGDLAQARTSWELALEIFESLGAPEKADTAVLLQELADTEES